MWLVASGTPAAASEHANRDAGGGRHHARRPRSTRRRTRPRRHRARAHAHAYARRLGCASPSGCSRPVPRCSRSICAATAIPVDVRPCRRPQRPAEGRPGRGDAARGAQRCRARPHRHRGASLGANLAVIVGGRGSRRCDCVALLSPGLDYRGCEVRGRDEEVRRASGAARGGVERPVRAPVGQARSRRPGPRTKPSRSKPSAHGTMMLGRQTRTWRAGWWTGSKRRYD